MCPNPFEAGVSFPGQKYQEFETFVFKTGLTTVVNAAKRGRDIDKTVHHIPSRL